MQENVYTFYDDTRYDNLTSLIRNGLPKPAKLSTFKTFKPKTDEIKAKLREVVNKEEMATATVPSEKATPVASVPETTPKEENVIRFPAKEVLEAKTLNETFYNENMNAKDEGTRRLKVAPIVRDSLEYTTNTIGGVYQEVEVSTEVSKTQENEVNVEENNVQNTEVGMNEETPSTFDFSALPGVVEKENNEDVNTSSAEDNSYNEFEDNHLEQETRLNDYLNRETSNNTNVFSESNLVELEEIKKLKREIEEARESLQQVKSNVGDLQEKDNKISEQLALYKKSLMEQRDAVNAELVNQTREWNDLTQLVRQKEALMQSDESYGMRRAA